MKVLIWLIVIQLLRPSSESSNDQQFSKYFDKGLPLFDKTIAAIGLESLGDFTQATTVMLKGYTGFLTNFTEAMWMVAGKKALNQTKLATVNSKLENLNNEIERIGSTFDANTTQHIQQYRDRLQVAKSAFGRFLTNKSSTAGDEFVSVQNLTVLSLSTTREESVRDIAIRNNDRIMVLNWTKWYIGTIILKRIVYAAWTAIESVNESHDDHIETIKIDSNNDRDDIEVHLKMGRSDDNEIVRFMKCGLFNDSLFCEDGDCCDIWCKQKRPLAFPCRPKDYWCDVAETCDGRWNSCPKDEDACSLPTYIGIAVGVGLILLALGLVAFWFLRK